MNIMNAGISEDELASTSHESSEQQSSDTESPRHHLNTFFGPVIEKNKTSNRCKYGVVSIFETQTKSVVTDNYIRLPSFVSDIN